MSIDPLKKRAGLFSSLSVALLILGEALLMTACGGGGGGGGGTSPPPTSNPVPTITSLSPSSTTAWAAAQTLTINGTNFLSSSSVTYNGAAHSATFVSSTQLTISLSVSDQATAGSCAVVVTNPSPGGGASNSVNFTVNNPVPSVTGLSPSSATAGAAAQTLTINGTNFLSSSTVTYNGVAHTAALVNSTQLTISLSTCDQATAGSYAVVVANPPPGGGSSNSVEFTVKHPGMPAITTQPQSQTVTAPATATFSVTTDGTTPLAYQWYKNGAAISSATSSTYMTPPTTWGTNGASFTVTVTNSLGSTTSTPATLTVNPPATLNLSPVGPVLIGGHPQSQTVVAGASATFTATAIGTEPITYQWNENGTPILGATSATYTTPATTSADKGATFTVTVTNSVNGFTSPPATLTVASAAVAPTLAGQPQDVTVNQGNTGYFSVSATGTGPLSYQWSKNGTPITDATDSTYTTPATTSADNNAQFTLTVTNAAGSATSGPATLFVAPTAGLGGFQLPVPGYGAGDPVTASDLIAAQYKFQVVTNQSQSEKIIFVGNGLYTPGSGIIYGTQSNIYSGSLSFADGGCTTYPPLGTYTEAYASLRNATADYPYQAGQTSAVGSAINTNDPVNWPIQTDLIDGIPNLYESVSMSQANLNGIEGLVTGERGNTLTDVSSFERCGLQMLSTTYRMWMITTQMIGYPTVINQIVVPDADARYIYPVQTMVF